MCAPWSPAPSVGGAPCSSSLSSPSFDVESATKRSWSGVSLKNWEMSLGDTLPNRSYISRINAVVGTAPVMYCSFHVFHGSLLTKCSRFDCKRPFDMARRRDPTMWLSFAQPLSVRLTASPSSTRMAHIFSAHSWLTVCCKLCCVADNSCCSRCLLNLAMLSCPSRPANVPSSAVSAGPKCPALFEHSSVLASFNTHTCVLLPPCSRRPSAESNRSWSDNSFCNALCRRAFRRWNSADGHDSEGLWLVACRSLSIMTCVSAFSSRIIAATARPKSVLLCNSQCPPIRAHSSSPLVPFQ